MSHSQFDGTLQLSHDEMRALGYQVVDMIIDHIEHLQDSSLARKADRCPALARCL